ncbi:MAG: branched-chain amino acid transport [Streptosporangiaceae bacterium]|jgi:branched-subunit amino acid transport protein|nr:branched-chain amino acid transport [Streptosporangiaceae bacterium]
MNVWIAVIATGLGCYGMKLAGLVAPQRVLDNRAVRRFTQLVAVALLTALVAVQTLAHGQALQVDGPRPAGLATAVAALLLRAPFLVVLAAAAGIAAGLRDRGRPPPPRHVRGRAHGQDSARTISRAAASSPG